MTIKEINSKIESWRDLNGASYFFQELGFMEALAGKDNPKTAFVYVDGNEIASTVGLDISRCEPSVQVYELTVLGVSNYRLCEKEVA